MRSIVTRRWGTAVVWMLIGMMVAPPSLLAQALLGGNSTGPIPFGLSAGPQAPIVPGQPIVINSNMLGGNDVPQAPCPGPGGGTTTTPAMTVDSLSGIERMTSGFAPSSSASPRSSPGPVSAGVRQSALASGPQSAGGSQAAGAGQSAAGMGQMASGSGQSVAPTIAGVGSSGNASIVLPKNQGLLSPLIQSQVEEIQGNVGTARLGQAPMEPDGQLSIEEAFSQFFLLQGMTNQLRQFGYNFFDLSFSSFPQVMDMPVGPDYVLGPEDSLAIHIWNVPDPNFNRTFITSVERDGTLFLPPVGTIPLSGSTFGQVQKIIHAKLSTVLKRFDLHISMGRLRSIKVSVVGEVIRPGAYALSSLATVSHALYAACGPAKSGSLRHVQLIRGNKVMAELDYYRFLNDGDRSQDLQLLSGDTVLIKPIGPVVAIGGPVRRPAIYEIKDQMTMPELIELAGGLAPSADRRRCTLFRVEAGKKRVIMSVNLESMLNGSAKTASNPGSMQLTDGDFVRIASVPLQIENAVT